MAEKYPFDNKIALFVGTVWTKLHDCLHVLRTCQKMRAEGAPAKIHEFEVLMLYLLLARSRSFAGNTLLIGSLH
jgi:hypothetical protein